MGQDIRNMVKEEEPNSPKLQEGHQARFAEKLQLNRETGVLETQSDRSNHVPWFKIAAAIIIFLGVGYIAYQNFGSEQIKDAVLVQTDEGEDAENTEITLGDLSPDLKKVEDFYTAGINVQLATLTTNPENKELIDGYMNRLQELDVEYKKLNKELNEVGPTEATITALVDNLKLRLELLFKLKNKLKELKQLENEQFIESNA